MAARQWGLVLLALLPACVATGPGTKVLRVPEEMKRQTRAPARTTAQAQAVVPAAARGQRLAEPAAEQAPDTRYTLRLAENGRVWELELPEDSGGYEVRIPLAGAGGPVEMLTSADEEMLAEATSEARQAAARAPEGEKAAATGPQAPAPAAGEKVVDARRAARTRSYLGGLAQVKELFAARRYELGLIEVVKLEKEYPGDARLLAMKGSLYVKLGQLKLARQAWEKALSINPDDLALAEALRAIAAGEE